MLRTLNFTGRIKIPREKASISLYREADGGWIFDAELDLAEFDFPADSQIFIEAFFKTASERFSWGKVGELTAPDDRQFDRRLKRLSQPELARFRVKIVESTATGSGRLLGVADGISPEGTGGAERKRVSLFRTDFKGELTDEIWRLNLDNLDGGGPILELNSAVPGIKELVRQPAFMALVFPSAMRQIYEKIFAVGCDPDDDPDIPWARWLRFGEQLAGRVAPPPSPMENEGDSDHKDWINDVITAWSRNQKVVRNFKAAYGEAK